MFLTLVKLSFSKCIGQKSSPEYKGSLGDPKGHTHKKIHFSFIILKRGDNACLIHHTICDALVCLSEQFTQHYNSLYMHHVLNSNSCRYNKVA